VSASDVVVHAAPRSTDGPSPFIGNTTPPPPRSVVARAFPSPFYFHAGPVDDHQTTDRSTRIIYSAVAYADKLPGSAIQPSGPLPAAARSTAERYHFRLFVPPPPMDGPMLDATRTPSDASPSFPGSVSISHLLVTAVAQFRSCAPHRTVFAVGDTWCVVTIRYVTACSTPQKKKKPGILRKYRIAKL